MRIDTEEASRIRVAALTQAAHDAKGSKSAEDVVKSAKIYADFLLGVVPDPKT